MFSRRFVTTETRLSQVKQTGRQTDYTCSQKHNDRKPPSRNEHQSIAWTIELLGYVVPLKVLLPAVPLLMVFR